MAAKTAAKKRKKTMLVRVISRLFSDLLLLARSATKNDDPYAALDALSRISRFATGIILLGIVGEIGWAVREFDGWPKFWATVTCH
jgi:hypothetical protein